MLKKAVLGFGSNKGSRIANIKKAVKLICSSGLCDFLAISPVYKTEPWGFKNQNNFLNCTAVCLTRLNPFDLFKFIKSVEKLCGRKFRAKWQQREIDIDILFYGNGSYEKNYLVIPHPLIQNRNFVLKPLVDLIPEYIHPVLNDKIFTLYKNSSDNCKVKLYLQKLVN